MWPMSNEADPVPQTLRDAWLLQTEAALLRECEMDAYRASGPGGQKRNKTSSAVRLRHGPSGIMVISEDSRSQHRNRQMAVRRLRMAIACQIRAEIGPGEPPPEVVAQYVRPDGRIRVAEENPDRARVIAFVLDSLQANKGALAEVAAALGSSSSQVVRLLSEEGAAFAAANAIRAVAGLHPLQR